MNLDNDPTDPTDKYTKYILFCVDSTRGVRMSMPRICHIFRSYYDEDEALEYRQRRIRVKTRILLTKCKGTI